MARRAVIPTLAIAAAAAVAVGCGSQNIELDQGEAGNIRDGAQIFLNHCSGCHTLAVVGAEGGATNVRNTERTDGPNFNVRVETVDQVLYAIRNGGFSGAIMPENIVTGQQAQDVAQFLAKYAGRERKVVPAPNTGG
jgi:mono/diheme cytochrome c family protein